MARKQYGFLASRSWRVRDDLAAEERARERERAATTIGRAGIRSPRPLTSSFLLKPLGPLFSSQKKKKLHPLSDKQAQHLALASLLLLTAALSLAPLFGASSAGMLAYAQRWAYQRDSMTSPFSVGAGYANFHASRGPVASAPLSSLPGSVVSRASPGLGVALAALLAASAAAALVLSLASLAGRGLLGLPGGAPLLSVVPAVLGASLLAVAGLFYGFTATGLRSHSAEAEGALGSRPPIFPSWGWVLSVLAAVGWLLVPGFAAGAAARPAGGRLFGGKRGEGGGGGSGAAGAAGTEVAAAADIEAGRGKRVATAAAAGAATAAAAAASAKSKASTSSADAEEVPDASADAVASAKAGGEEEAAAAAAAAAAAEPAAAPPSAVGGALAAGAAVLTSGAAAVSDTLVRLYSRGFSAREERSSVGGGGGGAEGDDVESGAEAESKREGKAAAAPAAAAAAPAAAAAAAKPKGKLGRMFSKSPSAREASAAAHDITTKAFASSSSVAAAPAAPTASEEKSALAAVEREAAELQAEVDAAVKEAATVASKDLEAARKSAIELKRSLTLELASKDLPSK